MASFFDRRDFFSFVQFQLPSPGVFVLVTNYLRYFLFRVACPRYKKTSVE